MDWVTIENSYFWISISKTFKSWTFRFKNPLSLKIIEYRIHKQEIQLVTEETEDEKKILRKKARRQEMKAYLEQVKKEEKKWFKIEREKANERAEKMAMARAQQQMGCTLGPKT
jgi:biopolymer transport protein ExbB/TolQ